MPQLTDLRITKVYKGKTQSFTKEDRSWESTPYNFYTDKNDDKYTYWHSGNKLIPWEGMRISYMEYSVERVAGKGDNEGRTFVNNIIKDMKLPDDEQPEIHEPHTSSPKGTSKSSTVSSRDEKSLFVCISYAKDAGIALTNMKLHSSHSFKDFCLEIVDAGIAMWEKAHGLDVGEHEIKPESEIFVDDKDTVAPLTDVPKGDFATKVPVAECPLDANKGDPVATIYCSSQCGDVATCMGFRTAMSNAPKDEIPEPSEQLLNGAPVPF